MNTENVIGNLRVLWRTERIIADLRLKHLLGSLGLKAFAALFAAFGLLLFELAAYFALVQLWGAIFSAALLGMFNFLLAALFAVVASKRPLPRELAFASEVQNSAFEALHVEARAFHASAFGALRHPWEGALAALLPRLIPIVIKAMKRPKAKAAAEPD
jgi:hypothetical protein